MRIDGKTKTCALFGNPVEHTISPIIHEILAELTNQNMAYIPLRIAENNLQEAVRGAWAMGLLGLNITIPYKEQVIGYLQEIDPLARNIGAVNTLVRTDSGFKGYNTDMPGLLRAMASDDIMIKDEAVILLGAGGVARAVAMMLSTKVHKLFILNRTYNKAQALADEVNEYADKRIATAYCLCDYEKIPEGSYITIQATSIGMHPNIEDVLIKENEFYQKVKIGYDLIYNPSNTTFMKKVIENGGQAFNGLKMLIYQGIIAFELWNNITITEEQAKIVYERVKDLL